MLLDRIDIDAHGPLHTVELGPFAEHLNVVCGPDASGKTAIARFVRDSLTDRHYPLGMLSSSTGCVVWADRNGLVHCRREQDGTAHGRRTFEFESRGDVNRAFDSLSHSWLDGAGASTDANRSVRSIQLPESIVDGVITDTALTSVARVVSACVRAGLDSQEAYRSLPLHEESSYQSRRGYVEPGVASSELYDDRQGRLRQELADVDAELSRLVATDADRQRLVARRQWLSDRLAQHPHADHVTPGYSVDPSYRSSRHHAWQRRLTELHDRARHLRAQQVELRRWLSEIVRDLANHPPVSSSRYQDYASMTDQHLRQQLDDLDAQLIRWRRALLEVRGLRNALLTAREHHSVDLISPLDEVSLRRARLDGFLRAIDRYDGSRNWDDFYPESYRPLHRIDDIHQRIDSATRQIDWLLDRYAGPNHPQHAWYETLPETGSRRTGSTLGDTLRAIREELHRVQSIAVRSAAHRLHHTSDELRELGRNEQWLTSAIDRLTQHRETLLRTHSMPGDPALADWSNGRYRDHYILQQERDASSARLDRVTSELNACLREAADVRRSTRSLPVIDSWYDDQLSHDWVDRDALLAELHRIDQRLGSNTRIDWLQTRRAQLLDQLRVVPAPAVSNSPLADAASHWLVRLSAGRLQRIHWPYRQFRDDHTSYHRDGHQRTGVTIQGRDETECSACDRALAVLAVRLAAGDLLARTGRPVPLVIETHRDLSRLNDASYTHGDSALAYYDHGDGRRSNHSIAAALRDYSRAGRQVVVLTSDERLNGQLSRVGARGFTVHAERIVHPHRPLWRSHYEGEHYVGPHPHTYGARDAQDTYADGRYRGVKSSGPTHLVADINRDFDMAWREAYGFYDNPDRFAKTSPRTDWARDGIEYRDGFYFTDSYTTNGPTRETHLPDAGRHAQRTSAAPRFAGPAPADSPFFLSVDSPIDQAPSIDAVAAARLRGLNVTHINHLMQQDSNRLSDALGLASVDASTIRRWQAECRLVCRVPQLRGFDARVLVGCGVTTPAQLASIHPVDLLHEVEGFLATDQGQQILLSGSSRELSRLTSWIAAANSSSDRVMRPQERGGDRRKRRRQRSYYRGFRNFGEAEPGFDSDRYEYEGVDPNVSSLGRETRRRHRIRRARQSRSDEQGSIRSRRSDRYGASNGTRVGRRSSSSGARNRNGSRTRRGSRSERNGYGYGQSENGSRSSRAQRSRSQRPQRDVVRYQREERARHDHEQRDQRYEYDRESVATQTQEIELRFYLHRESPVVDAPSIGARMSERLSEVGIVTVDDLLNADPDSTAEVLDHRRVTSETVVQWQQQATLVCRVPMLRGHDAQLLVAAEVTTPEELASSDAEELFAAINPIANSTEGKRIIRGGKAPDLDEVVEWISFAQHQRELRAA